MNAKLHKYQREVGNFMICHPKCGIFLDVGLGKTLTTLAVLEKLYAHPMETGHILVIAPKAIARATWAAEIKKWDVKLPYQSLIVNDKGKQFSRKQRIKAYETAYRNPIKTVYFINQDLLSDLIEWCPVDGTGRKIWKFQTVVVDELQNFKSHDSKRFKMLRLMSPAIHRFIGLTGTPTPNGIGDIWSEIALMDDGLRLGKNITAFRAVYMQPGYTNDKGVVCSWNPKPGAEQIIYQRISDIVISLKNTVLQLPPISYVEDTIYLDDNERKLYAKFKKEAVLNFGGEIATAANSAVMHNKLSQLASGTVYTVDCNGKPTGNYELVHQRKLERLLYIRNNTDDNLLVGYHFKSDLQEIMKYMTANNIPFEVFDSNKADDIRERWNAGKIPMLLAHPASAGAGLNIQEGGHTLVWYTLPERLEHYQQLIGRIYRQGQTQPVVIHHILTAGTIDKPNYTRLQNKDESQQSLIDAVQMAIDMEAEI